MEEEQGAGVSSPFQMSRHEARRRSMLRRQTQVEKRDCPSPVVTSYVTEFAFALGLSVREAVVLALAAGTGMSRKEVAYRLGCRPGTVDTYWQRMIRKCGLGSPLEVLAAVLTFSFERCTLERAEAIPAAPELARYRAAIDAAIRGNHVASVQPAGGRFVDRDAPA